MDKKIEYKIDCEKFCGYIEVDNNGIICKTMDVFRVFKGQHITKLTKWVSKKFGYCTLKKMEK